MVDFSQPITFEALEEQYNIQTLRITEVSSSANIDGLLMEAAKFFDTADDRIPVLTLDFSEIEVFEPPKTQSTRRIPGTYIDAHRDVVEKLPSNIRVIYSPNTAKEGISESAIEAVYWFSQAAKALHPQHVADINDPQQVENALTSGIAWNEGTDYEA